MIRRLLHGKPGGALEHTGRDSLSEQIRDKTVNGSRLTFMSAAGVDR